MKKIVELKNVSKIYTMGETKVKAVDDMSFSINEGEFVVVLGASGAGKTTVLNLLGGMDKPTKGEIIVENQNIDHLSDKKLTVYRRNKIGFIFQFYNLITNLTAKENVEFASVYSRDKLDPEDILNRVGLGERLENFPSQLSGGEQQRVAIARAIAKNPTLLLCDEPTGALDYQTGKAVLRLLSQIHQEYKKTIILITHNIALVDIADKIIRIKSGKVEEIKLNENKKDIEEIEW